MSNEWIAAHVGEDSTTIGVRLTAEEKERLERLRSDLRLTSKGQVIRAALDMLEVLNMPGRFLVGGAAGVRRLREEAEQVREIIRREHSEAGDDSGLPAGAAASDLVEEKAS